MKKLLEMTHVDFEACRRVDPTTELEYAISAVESQFMSMFSIIACVAFFKDGEYVVGSITMLVAIVEVCTWISSHTMNRLMRENRKLLEADSDEEDDAEDDAESRQMEGK